MEQQHVYHHHYHYHYIYPFPPGLPPNAPPHNEPLNQEVAGHNDGEPSVEEGGEEHSERHDTEDQQTPENRSPSPVQEDTEDLAFERAGFVVFDDSLACLDLDHLSIEAQARFTNTEFNNDDHQEGPPRKKARTSTNPEQPVSGGIASNSATQPLQSDHITVIVKARIVVTDSGFRVVNCNTSGPQIDICWRVPGRRNIWLARLGSAGRSIKELNTLMNAQAPPSMPLVSSLESALDEENTLSLIEFSHADDSYDDFEGGGGQVVPRYPEHAESLFALGRMVGFEVV